MVVIVFVDICVELDVCGICRCVLSVGRLCVCVSVCLCIRVCLGVHESVCVRTILDGEAERCLCVLRRGGVGNPYDSVCL